MSVSRSTDPCAAPALGPIERAADEMTALIRTEYQAATFAPHWSEDPAGLYLHVYVAPADIDRLWALCEDRVLELTEEELPLYLVPLDVLEP